MWKSGELQHKSDDAETNISLLFYYLRSSASVLTPVLFPLLTENEIKFKLMYIYIDRRWMS